MISGIKQWRFQLLNVMLHNSSILWFGSLKSFQIATVSDRTGSTKQATIQGISHREKLKNESRRVLLQMCHN